MINLNELTVTVSTGTGIRSFNIPVPSTITRVQDPEFYNIGNNFNVGTFTTRGGQFNSAGTTIEFEYRILISDQVLALTELWRFCDRWKSFSFDRQSLADNFPDPLLVDVLDNKSLFETWVSETTWTFAEPLSFSNINEDKPRPLRYKTNLTIRSQVV